MFRSGSHDIAQFATWAILLSVIGHRLSADPLAVEVGWRRRRTWRSSLRLKTRGSSERVSP